MKNKYWIFLCLWMMCPAMIHSVSAGTSPSSADVIIADFNDGQTVNNIGNPVEAWLKEDGTDQTQSCRMQITGEDALGIARGKSLRIDYDVDSPNPAYNGIRIGLKNLHGQKYKMLNFYVRGDERTGFTPRLKIEMIGEGQSPSPFIIDGITAKWKKFSIPLSSFFGIKNWDTIDQFTIVFADISSSPKMGTIYLDQVYLSKA